MDIWENPGACFPGAEPIKLGRKVSVVESKVTDDQNRVVAEATFTVVYL